MTLTNAQILSILKTMNSDSEDTLIRRKMPTKILYSLHRSVPSIEAAYKAYDETLQDLCKRYGVTVQTVGDIPANKAAEFNKSVAELLNTSVLVDIHPIDEKELDGYDDEKFDPLSLAELETLYLLSKKEDQANADNQKDR